MSGSLMPCPFCGAQACVGQEPDGAFYVACRHVEGCYLRDDSTLYSVEKNMVDAWNSRRGLLACAVVKSM